MSAFPASSFPILVAAAAGMLVWLAPDVVYAYLGPGGTLSAVGTVVAVVLTIVAALLGFLYYPLKRLIRRRRRAQRASRETDRGPDEGSGSD